MEALHQSQAVFAMGEAAVAQARPSPETRNCASGDQLRFILKSHHHLRPTVAEERLTFLRHQRVEIFDAEGVSLLCSAKGVTLCKKNVEWQTCLKLITTPWISGTYLENLFFATRSCPENLLYVPKDSSSPIPSTCIDVVRQTKTDLDNSEESSIDDLWNSDEHKKNLSGSCIGSTRFRIQDKRPRKVYSKVEADRPKHKSHRDHKRRGQKCGHQFQNELKRKARQQWNVDTHKIQAFFRKPETTWKFEGNQQCPVLQENAYLPPRHRSEKLQCQQQARRDPQRWAKGDSLSL